LGEKLDRYISPKPEIEIGPRFSGENKFRILFLIANPYKVGIANLGWQVIVHYILSNFPDVSIKVEYVDTLPPLSWNEFDLIAVSAPFETTYPNVIKMLYRIGLPLFRKVRKDPMPIVVAGGILNPYPLVDFIDVFVFGDGRKPLAEIIDLCRSGMSRNRILEILSSPRYRNMGIFVPEFHESGEKIFANPELPLNEYPIHTIWSSKENPYGFKADYLSVMVALGCDRKCPFCAVSHCQGLLSKREDKHLSVEKILEILEWRRGFGKVNVVKLFFASSIRVEELKEMLKLLMKEKVKVLVGSLNCQQIDEELLELLKVAGPNRVIIAPETNEEQRWKVNKGYITDERIFEIVGLCNKYSLPMTLYLMYGLSGEKDEDVKKLGGLVREIRKSLNKNLDLKVYNVPLFPKPHTPFEFAEQISPEDSQRRFSLFKEGLRGLANLEIKTEDPDLALLQALLSRGDSGLKRLLITLSVRSGVEGLIQEIGKILPNWREYFREREDISSLPWKDIIFSQPHEVLFSRWQTIKNKLN
jgi:radical SAM superfamily enzyme YgiQ (UPF0313 family)